MDLNSESKDLLNVPKQYPENLRLPRLTFVYLQFKISGTASLKRVSDVTTVLHSFLESYARNKALALLKWLPPHRQCRTRHGKSEMGKYQQQETTVNTGD